MRDAVRASCIRFDIAACRVAELCWLVRVLCSVCVGRRENDGGARRRQASSGMPTTCSLPPSFGIPEECDRRRHSSLTSAGVPAAAAAAKAAEAAPVAALHSEARMCLQCTSRSLGASRVQI